MTKWCNVHNIRAKLLIYRVVGALLRMDLRPIDYSVGWGLRDNSSHLFLWGECTRKLFKKRKNVTIVGNPALDHFYNKYHPNARDKDLSAELGLKSVKSVLVSALCISDIDVNMQQSVLDWYREIIKNLAEYNIIIKIHPRDSENYFSDLLSFSNLFIVENDVAFSNLLKVSDLNVSHYSATSIDAIMYGIPVVLLPFTAVTHKNKVYWFGSNVFAKPETSANCVDDIKRLITDEFIYTEIRQEFLVDMASKKLGTSGSKVAAEIMKILFSKEMQKK